MKKPAKTTLNVPNVQLKRARERKGWSQEQVGQEIGTDAFTVSRWERGVTMPGPHFRQKLCALFDMSVVELGLVRPEIDEGADAAAVSSNEIVLVSGPVLDPAIPPPPARHCPYAAGISFRGTGTGQYEQAHTLLDESLALFRDLQDRRWIALTVREQGMLAREQEQFELAYELFEEALDIFRQLRDQHEAAVTHTEHGILARHRGRLDVAHEHLAEALVSMRQTRDRRNVAYVLKEIAILKRHQGQLDEALRLLLSAGVGLELITSPDARTAEKLLRQVYIQIGEETFSAAARSAAQEAPEAAYGLDQAAWSTAVQKLVAQGTRKVKK